jgi:opacity protein-like surface antigen
VKRILLALVCAVALALAAPVMAANPHSGGGGQPNQSCVDQTSSPPGFNSEGFENVADAHYAGEGSHSLNANSDSAVSQYDVACFQVS